jgi:hypothetical protein
MQAVGGHRAKKLKLAPGGKAPKMPKGLTPAQRKEWKSTADNPVSRGADEALLVDRINVARVRDLALEAIERDGILVDRKSAAGDVIGKMPNPAWPIFRSCIQTLTRLRSMMLTNPKDQALLRAAGVLDLEPHKPRQRQGGVYLDDVDDDADMLDDDDDDQPARELDPNDTSEKFLADLEAREAREKANPRRRRKWGFNLD